VAAPGDIDGDGRPELRAVDGTRDLVHAALGVTGRSSIDTIARRDANAFACARALLGCSELFPKGY
jgi:hypothetical protein